MSSLPTPGDSSKGLAASSLSVVRKLRDTLRGVDGFTHLKMDELELLIEHLKFRTVQAGTVLIEQGDKNADAFYMIAAGRCTVWIKKGKNSEKVADLGAESYFGERALITSEPRAATVRAEVPTELFVLYKEDFNAIMKMNPAIGLEFKKHFAQYKR